MKNSVVLMLTFTLLMWALPTCASVPGAVPIDLNVDVVRHAEIEIMQHIAGDEWYLGPVDDSLNGTPGPFTGEPETRSAAAYLKVTTNADDLVLNFSVSSNPANADGIQFPIDLYVVNRYQPYFYNKTLTERNSVQKALESGVSLWALLAQGTISEAFQEIPSGNYHGSILVTVTPQ